jgi:integrase
MDMAKYPGLFQRGQVWWFRRVVPKAFRKVVGRSELLQSLETKDRDEAEARYFAAAKRANDTITNAKTGQLPVRDDWEIRALAEEWFEYEFPAAHRRYTRESEARFLNPDDYDPRLADGVIGSQLVVLLSDTADLTRRLSEFIAEKRLGIHERDEDYRRLRAAAEDVYRETYPHTPQYADTRHQPLSLVISAPVAPVDAQDVPISKAFEMYRAEKEANGQKLSHAMLSEWTTAIRRFQQVNGGDIGVRGITKAHVLAFKQALMSLPARPSNAVRKLTVPQMIALGGSEAKMKAASVNKNISALSTVLAFCERNGLAGSNATTRMKLPEVENERLPYTLEDLRTIFTSGWFTDRGERKANFWLPLLGAFTGCRLEEMGQALTEDVKVEDGIHYLDITTINDEEKRLKTKNSKRRVPLHPELIKLGFFDYVAGLRKRRERDVFPDLHRTKQGKKTKVWSQRYGRYARDIGITDDRKVFHSFRHLWKDRSRLIMEEAVQDAILGHSNGKVGRGYGDGYPIQRLAEDMAKIMFPGLDLGHLYLG